MTDPQRLVAELTAAGWTVEQQDHGHTRLAWPGHLSRRRFLLVPSNTAAPDFPVLWADTITQLEAAVDVGVKAAHVLAGQFE